MKPNQKLIDLIEKELDSNIEFRREAIRLMEKKRDEISQKRDEEHLDPLCGIDNNVTEPIP
jgi:hypothetical protein